MLVKNGNAGKEFCQAVARYVDWTVFEDLHHFESIVYPHFNESLAKQDASDESPDGKPDRQSKRAKESAVKGRKEEGRGVKEESIFASSQEPALISIDGAATDTAQEGGYR